MHKILVLVAGNGMMKWKKLVGRKGRGKPRKIYWETFRHDLGYNVPTKDIVMDRNNW